MRPFDEIWQRAAALALVVGAVSCGSRASKEDASRGDAPPSATRDGDADAASHAETSTAVPSAPQSDGDAPSSTDPERQGAAVPTSPVVTGAPNGSTPPTAASVAPTPPVSSTGTQTGLSPDQRATCAEGLHRLETECDVEDRATWGIDCDGDGKPGLAAQECDAGEIIPLPLTEHDCDDTDPTLSTWIGTDADADGWTNDDPALCAPAVIPDDSAPASNSHDCDDAEPNVHPEAVDVWGDGLDTDCSGDDGLNCNVIADATPEIAVTLNENCPEQPDIAFGAWVNCGNRCGDTPGTLHGFVENRGGADFVGTIRVVAEAAEYEVVIPYEGLGAGQSPGPFTIDTQAGSLEIRLELLGADGGLLTDCDSSDEVFEFEFRRLACR